MSIEALGRWVMKVFWRLGLSGPTSKGEPEYVLSQDGYKEYRFIRKRYTEEFTGHCVRTGGAQREPLAEVKEGDKAETVWLEAVPVKEDSACGCQRLLRLIYKDEPLLVDLFEQHEHAFISGDYKTRMYVSELEEFLCDPLYSELSRHTLKVSGRGPLVTCRASHEGTCADLRHLMLTSIELDIDLDHKRADLRVKESSQGSTPQ